MGKRKIRTRIKRLLLSLFILSGLYAAAMQSGCSRSQNVYYSYSGRVSVSLGMGQESVLVADKPLPVSVTVEGEYATAGKWCELTVPTNEGDYYAYRRELGEQSSQVIEFVVPAAYGSTQLVLQLLDEEENVFYSRTCTYQFDDGERILAGSLDMQTDTVPWPEAVTRDGVSTPIKTVALTPSNLFSQPEAYEMFDFIVLEQSSCETLGEEVIHALALWAEAGGCLVIEGEKDFPDCEEFGGLEPGVRRTRRFGSLVALEYSSLGRGSIWFSKEPLSQAAPKLTDGQKTELLCELAGGSSGTYGNEGRSERFVREVLLTQVLALQGTASGEPAVWQYILLIGCYLVVGIPAVFLFTRGKNRLRWFRPALCGLAIAFATVIYAAGSTTRFTKPFLQAITFTGYDGKMCREDIYIRVQAPYNSSYSVSISPDFRVRSVPHELDWNQETYSNYSRRTARLTQNEGTDIVLANLVAFTPRYFCLSRITPSDRGIEKGAEKGLALINSLGQDLSSVILVKGTQVYLVNEWKQGEGLDIYKGLYQGSVQSMSLLQFREGGYQNRAGWDGAMAEYYGILMEDWEPDDDVIYVAGTAAEQPSFQKDTAYSVSGGQIVWARVPLNGG